MRAAIQPGRDRPPGDRGDAPRPGRGADRAARPPDAAAHDALMLAAQQGCTTLLQIELGRQAQLSVGFRDDYNVTRWVHAIPLH